MPMLADLVDAVVGVDTHCDTHEVQIALPTGRSIATTSISNDTTGYAQLLAWILDHAPGPRMAIAIEGRVVTCVCAASLVARPTHGQIFTSP